MRSISLTPDIRLPPERIAACHETICDHLDLLFAAFDFRSRRRTARQLAPVARAAGQRHGPARQAPAEMGRQDQHQMENAAARTWHSTPIVWGDLVFVLTAIDTGREAAAADFPNRPWPPRRQRRPDVSSVRRPRPRSHHRQSPLEAVAAEEVPHEGHHPSHSLRRLFALTTDGKFLYVSFGSFGIFCYDFAGKLQWKRDRFRPAGNTPGLGRRRLPVIHGDSLIAGWDQEGPSSLYVLDARTGEDALEGRSARRSPPGTRRSWSITKAARRSS